MTDSEFASAFESCTLPSEEFHHRHHVRLAWIYFQRHAFIDAAARFITDLKRYATSLGKPALYHETITWAYLILIHERVKRAPSDDWETFAGANDDLFQKTILEKYYRTETLASDHARVVFVMPDR